LEVIAGSRALTRRLQHPIVTVGNFDGLHLGHQEIMRVVCARARALRGEAVVYTFEPHPRKVLTPERAPALLTTLDQKLELLEHLGIDAVIVETFTPEFARTPPDRFVREFLYEPLRPREVYVGYDFHFGKDREGSMRQLTELGPRLGFAVTIVPEVTVGNRDVNSTRIRQLIAEGAVEAAAELLGRSFGVRGRIVGGERRGRGLGFPTANVEAETEVRPANGVYAGALRFLDEGVPQRGASFAAVINVGLRPTFTSSQRPVVEAHLLDFSGEIYDRRVDLAFCLRLRDERRFPGAAELKEQIARDVEAARERLKGSAPAWESE